MPFSIMRKTSQNQGIAWKFSSQYYHDLLWSRCWGYLRVYYPSSFLTLAQIAIGALLAWPTFGLHVEFDPELFPVRLFRRCCLRMAEDADP